MILTQVEKFKYFLFMSGGTRVKEINRQMVTGPGIMFCCGKEKAELKWCSVYWSIFSPTLL